MIVRSRFSFSYTRLFSIKGSSSCSSQLKNSGPSRLLKSRLRRDPPCSRQRKGAAPQQAQRQKCQGAVSAFHAADPVTHTTEQAARKGP